MLGAINSALMIFGTLLPVVVVSYRHRAARQQNRHVGPLLGLSRRW